MNFLESFAYGFGTSFVLILAIGAQNAFVLRQGIRRDHVFKTALFCGLSDAFLIILGVFGLGKIITQSETLMMAFLLAGAAFLIYYGIKNVKSALRGTAALEIDESPAKLTKKALFSTLFALTFLNPHVYLDTMALIGSVSVAFDGQDKIAFTIGAIGASFTFFFSLAYGATLLAPFFSSPKAWVALDLFVAAIMFFIAASLIYSLL